ncbi:MAG: AAA-like domain-containing protein [Lachnospiraceae bacterium]
MPKKFNITGTCIPEKNYMVDMNGRIDETITSYIKEGKYFTINRARQYGKTTMLYLLEERMKSQYIVLSLSFEAADDYFNSLYNLAEGLVMDISDALAIQGISQDIISTWNESVSERFPMRSLGNKISELCRNCDKDIVLMIDEVDQSSDNQIFLTFLGLLRSKYLRQRQGKDTTFKSVILAGVYDIKNLKLKLRPGEESKYNSPWNIAADFSVDMCFYPEDIASMLREYEQDYHTEMDIPLISQQIYDYTSGYPYLVSRICQLMDEKLPGKIEFPDRKAAWTREGVVAAELLLRKESNTLFDDMVKKLSDYPLLKEMIQNILFTGYSYPFDKENQLINLGYTFGFLKDKDGTVVLSNRIFETRMYDLFISEMAVDNAMYQVGASDRNQFVISGKLQMDQVMRKFFEYFTEIYRDSDEKFIEDQGRKLFLLYLKPIINGSGNYYVEAQTRDLKRTDIIVDYHGVQYVIELKIWHGDEYNRRGENQLFEYLEYYKQDTGYMLSFNFNKRKHTGIRELVKNGKRIMEIVV